MTDIKDKYTLFIRTMKIYTPANRMPDNMFAGRHAGGRFTL